jgi:hypothetical protein
MPRMGRVGVGFLVGSNSGVYVGVGLLGEILLATTVAHAIGF